MIDKTSMRPEPQERVNDRASAGPSGVQGALPLVVIGHVNHGKTALVRALTGMETDRLKEEVERGLSITLGFAWRDYPGGAVDFIDSPGHEDFIRAMAVGAAGARAALLVVSATEGFGRQTREHLKIASLLGVRAGVVAVTKADLLPDGGEAAAREAVAAELRGGFLDGAPIVLCSSLTGVGLEELHHRLEDLAKRSPPQAAPAGAFLPLDRVFSIVGAGTVATGTLQGGALEAGDEAILQPSGRKVSLRQIQVHGQAVEVAQGGRVAVGLRGAATDEVRAGEVLCAPGAYAASLQVDVSVALSDQAAKPLKHMDEVRVLWGARSDIAKVRLIGITAIAPGDSGLAQLQFHAPVVAFAGQRAVLRRPSPAETLGGAVVLDPVARPSRGRRPAHQAVLTAAASGNLKLIAARLADRDLGIVSIAELARLSRRSSVAVDARLAADHEDLGDGRLAPRSAVADASQAYLDVLGEAHRKAPTRAWLSASAIRRDLKSRASPELAAYVERALGVVAAIRLQGGQVALAGHDPLAALSAKALERLRQIEAALIEGGLSPPDPALLPGANADSPELIQLLIGSDRAVILRNHALRQDLLFHLEPLRAARRALASAFPPPAEFTTGEARAALETSRKFIVPILEYFDTQGATVRRGDRRMVTDTENPLGLSQGPL